ncbi:MAG: hypothetical protein A2W31_02185 [Planctomycetes bacterium RBG_16_64_10]|nr:MAG: hypothetical protein A2W31_02185 [Planctomycetes bacterium RBG_16_64_10]
MTRERKTLTAMLRMYCRGRHGGGEGWCAKCAPLHAYAMARLARCPFGAEKPPCADCPIHCYQVNRRAEIRAVMRHAGPRMLWRHPLLAIAHVLDGRRPAPATPRTTPSATTQAAGTDHRHLA